MKSYHIYNKYKIGIHKAKQSFGHYEKYKNCFSIRSMDNEMGEIFIKLGLHYSKLMHLVTDRNKNSEIKGEPDLVSIDECEKLLKEKASFFNNIICFLERNEKRIIELLNSGTIDAMSNEVNAIETNVTNADKVVNRMDSMIISSQQIYTVG
ncbi:MAG: hypothetical protein ABIN95_06630 [Mucilaginibacter sp.]